jgi:hypothetical protein
VLTKDNSLSFRDALGEQLRRGRLRSNAMLSGVAAITAVLLTACAQDQVKRTDIITPRDGHSAVVTGANEVDLIDGPASVVVNTALWNRAANFKVGTGVINPFLSLQNSPTEQGFNTDGTFTLDQTRSQFTNALPLNHVPVINVKNGGGAFREFIFDANEANSTPDAQFSIDQFNLWLCNDAAAGTFTTRTQFESNAHCSKVYSLDGKTLLATDANSLGSGSDFDYQILIPDNLFVTAAEAVGVNANTDCAFNGANSEPCGSFIILDVKMGGKGGDFTTGATFEEFSTLNRPFVTVTKTATPSFTRRFNWQIAKSVNPTDITLFDGQSQNATWTVNVTPGVPAFTDSNGSLSGTVTISNTSGAAVSILSIVDQIDASQNVTLNCPNGTGPITLANGATYVCTYSTPATVTPGAHVNVATVGIDAGADVDPSTFKGSAQFNFANAVPTEIDKNPNVFDNNNGEGEKLLGTASTGTFTYEKTYTCGADQTVSNVARVDITNPPDDPTATATLHVHCLKLTVAKTATTAKRRTFQWAISKSAQPSSWTLFNGDQGTTKYEVIVAPAATPFIDDNISVTGTITVHNPNGVSVFIQSVSDALSGAGAPAITPNCNVTFPFTLAAGSDLICPYGPTILPDGSLRTNTATAVAKPTAAGTNKSFSSAPAPVDPSAATLTEVNKTVHVTDNFNSGGDVALGTVTSPNTGTFNPTHTFACGADAGTFTNVAKITETAQQATASVTVNCRDLTVTKTADTKFRRKWTWGVTKTINPSATDITLAINEQYVVGYTVVYSSAKIDDNFRVGGTVTVTNPASSGPAATTTATINSLTDLVSGPIAAALTCPNNTFPQTLAAGASLVCTYTDVSLPDKTVRTNTATAKRANNKFAFDLTSTSLGTETARQGTANVAFGAVPNEGLDECVNVADSNPGTTVTGKLCATDANKTFTYSKTLQFATCGAFTVPNTASFVTTPGTSGSNTNTATPLTGSASVTINVTVPCPQGCTLTLGYWKTHNASFHGGAPIDDNWNNVTPAKELSGFFTTSNSFPVLGPNTPPFTWFGVFGTPPKGNPFFILSQQYMAAKLNYLNNAGQVPTVTTAIASAEAFFSHAGNTPGNWPNTGTATSSTLTTLAGILGSYNEGTIGPGHCSEDNTSAK